jgi:hypothetical protein
MFGQLSNGGRATNPLVWHVLRPAGEGWTTVCTASAARPGLTVVNLSGEPGPTVCKLKSVGGRRRVEETAPWCEQQVGSLVRGVSRTNGF